MHHAENLAAGNAGKQPLDRRETSRAARSTGSVRRRRSSPLGRRGSALRSPWTSAAGADRHHRAGTEPGSGRPASRGRGCHGRSARRAIGSSRSTPPRRRALAAARPCRRSSAARRLRSARRARPRHVAVAPPGLDLADPRCLLPGQPRGHGCLVVGGDAVVRAERVDAEDAVEALGVCHQEVQREVSAPRVADRPSPLDS